MLMLYQSVQLNTWKRPPSSIWKTKAIAGREGLGIIRDEKKWMCGSILGLDEEGHDLWSIVYRSPSHRWSDHRGGGVDWEGHCPTDQSIPLRKSGIRYRMASWERQGAENTRKADV